MQDYNTIISDFIQYKQFLGYKYSTDKTVLNEIRVYLINESVNIITKEIVEKYARINLNLNPNTLARNMGVFRELCNYIYIHRGIECYQIPKSNYPQNHQSYKPHIFSHKEIYAIYDNMDKYEFNNRYQYYKQLTYPLIIKILYQTGIRIGELLSVTINNYNSDLGIFTLIDTKNNQERNVAISDDINKEIKKYCNKFISCKDEIIFKVSANAVRKYFKKILTLSDIIIYDDSPRLHDLRHTYICHCIEKAIEEKIDSNVFLPILQAQLGHQSLNALSYYFKLNDDIFNVVNKISEQELGYLMRGIEENE